MIIDLTTFDQVHRNTHTIEQEVVAKEVRSALFIIVEQVFGIVYFRPMSQAIVTFAY